MGSALQLVDDKNRVSIPAKFRDAVVANTPSGVFTKNPFVLVGQHPESPCLIAYDRGWVAERLAKGQESAEGLSFNELRLLGGGAEEVSFDATGRAVLHNWMKEEARIDKHAFFYGSVTNFEIWDPRTLMECDTAAPVLKRICRSLMQDKGL